MNKSNLSLIGFLQALSLIIYCSLIAGLFWIADNYFRVPPRFLGTVIMLLLFVFSAAITGSIVFGYPVYLALNQKIKEALSVFAYTLLYCLAFIIIAIILILSLYWSYG